MYLLTTFSFFPFLGSSVLLENKQEDMQTLIECAEIYEHVLETIQTTLDRVHSLPLKARIDAVKTLDKVYADTLTVIEKIKPNMHTEGKTFLIH